MICSDMFLVSIKAKRNLIPKWVLRIFCKKCKRSNWTVYNGMLLQRERGYQSSKMNKWNLKSIHWSEIIVDSPNLNYSFIFYFWSKTQIDIFDKQYSKYSGSLEHNFYYHKNLPEGIPFSSINISIFPHTFFINSSKID